MTRAQPIRILTDVGLTVRMRDGIDLATDVYRPATAEPAPTLLMRTPYGRGQALFNGFYDGLRFVREGYAVVIQDTRGRFDSGGTFYPFRDETDDGLDTIAWVVAQDWSDGQVGTIGASYVGATQWLPAGQNPAALRAMAPIVTAADYRDGWIYRGGAFELGFSLAWTLGLCLDTAQRRIAQGQATPDLLERARDALDRLESLYGGLDADADALLRDLAPYYFDWRAHQERDSAWPSIAPDPRAGSTLAPALDIGGWHDIFLTGTLDNFRQQQAIAIAAGHPRPRLLVGPWSHGVYSGRFPGRTFGVQSGIDVAGLADEQVDWFDRRLRGRTNGVDERPPVRLFVMGSDHWRDFDDWPPTEVDPRSFYLRGDTDSFEDGDAGGHSRRLTTDSPSADERRARLIFDARDPVPTVGGGSLLAGATLGERAGPADLASIARRSDVLSYESEPLDRPLTVIGPVQLRVRASASVASFDLAAQLADVHPSGRRELLTAGILRVGPGRDDGEMVVELGSTAAVLDRGHRVGLTIAASDFPRFDLNPVAAAAGRMTGWIGHAAERPSRLILPVLER